MIYIYALKGNTNREIAETWQHSGSTISAIINEVATIFNATGSKLMVSPYQVSDRIANNKKFAGFFDNCIGALDGCHVSAIAPAAEQGLFRNRKGFISQNVLGVVNFDLTFSYVLAGWEGCAHDGEVLRDAIFRGLYMQVNKFYLGDAGYGLSKFKYIATHPLPDENNDDSMN